MPVAELATITLIPGSNVFDSGSEAARIWQGMIDTISRQAGFEHLYSGREHERPEMAQLVVVWDGLESHQSFQKSKDYQPMLDSLEPIMAGPPQLLHFELNSYSSLTAAVSAPATELATVFVTGKTPSFYENLGSFAQVLRNHAEGFQGVCYGWCIEQVEHESLNTGRGSACLLAIGWQSIAAHLAFKNSDAFQRGLELLKDARGSEIHHTIFRNTS